MISTKPRDRANHGLTTDKKDRKIEDTKLSKEQIDEYLSKLNFKSKDVNTAKKINSKFKYDEDITVNFHEVLEVFVPKDEKDYYKMSSKIFKRYWKKVHKEQELETFQNSIWKASEMFNQEYNASNTYSDMHNLIFEDIIPEIDHNLNQTIETFGGKKEKRGQDSKISSSVKSVERFRRDETGQKDKSYLGSDLKPLQDLNYNDVFNDFNESKVINAMNKTNLSNNLNTVMEVDSNFNIMNTLTNNNFKSAYDNINEIDIQDQMDGQMGYGDYYNNDEIPEYEKKEEQINQTIQNELMR